MAPSFSRTQKPPTGDTSIAGDVKASAVPGTVAEISQQIKPEAAKPEPANPEPAKRKYVKADLSKITLDMATATPLEETDLATVPSEDTEPRSDVQKQIDAQFKDAYTAWEAAGKPKTVRECYEHDRAVHAEFKAKGEQAPHTRLIVRRFLLEPEQEPAFRALVRKAGELGGHSAKVLPIASHVSGRHVLVWMPRDVVKRAAKNATGKVASPATEAAK